MVVVIFKWLVGFVNNVM